jgi:hypothetical protein
VRARVRRAHGLTSAPAAAARARKLTPRRSRRCPALPRPPRSSVPKSVKSAKEFTPEVLHLVLVRALKLIAPEDEGIAPLADKLPANVAARHRLATGVSNAIKALGYSGEGGYNQLLYPNERDVRRLLSWVVQKLPRAEDGSGGEGGPMAALHALLFRNAANWMSGAAAAGSGSSSGGSSSAAGRAPVARALAAAEGELVAASAAGANTRSGAAAPAARASGALRDAVAAATRAEHARPAADTLFHMSLALRDALRIALGGGGEGDVGVGGGAGASGMGTGAAAVATTLAPLEKVAEQYAADVALRASARRGGHRGPPLPASAAHFFPGTHLDAHPCMFTRRTAYAVQVVRVAAPPPAPAVVAVTQEAPKAKTEEEVHREREEELARLQAEVDEATAAAEGLAANRALLAVMLPQLRAQLAAVAARTAELERAYLLRKACMDMLPNAEEHLARLGRELDAGAAKLVALGLEWEAHRGPLMAAVAAEEAARTSQAARLAQLQQEMADMRAQMADIAAGAAGKEEQAKRMAAEYARMQAAAAAAAGGSGGGDALVTRPVYTRRILDIVRQIRKQKEEIARIVGDVRQVQAALTAVGDKVRKTAASATDMMERAAVEHAKDPAYRQVLRQVLALQDAFANLLTVVTAIGQAENETRDTENRVEQMAQRNDSTNTAQVQRDLAQVRQENAALQQQLA